MKRAIKFCLGLLFILGYSFLYSQEDNSKSSTSKFDKFEAFSPIFMTEMANSFNSASGKPGPNYWQNRADYDIQAQLDTVEHRIQGKMTLTYTNNSPYDLDYLWLQLDQNAFREDSRSKALYPADDRNGVRTPTEGFELNAIKVNQKDIEYLVDDTRLQIRLDEPLRAKGNQLSIQIDYEYAIPTHGKDRTGRVETRNGWIYTIAQWYPRMAVFDEAEGWNNLPYLGTGEFYLEYGNFTYAITAPENMLVVGSGVLQNPKKVLTKTQQERLAKAKKSDETVYILTKEEMREGTHFEKGKSGMRTWEFNMQNTRDVAWAASKAFIWDAAKINLPNGKTALAQSVYPEENSGQDGYARSTEYTKHSVEINSRNWYPYPYEVATNVGGHEGGMEYPGLVFCSYESKNEQLWGVIDHEFGHTWFPMIVGSNERVYPWLDEGLNTFINDIAAEEFNDGEYAEDKNFQGMGSVLFNKNMNPLFTRADVVHNQYNLAYEAYFKPAYALHVLRNVVLGKERFDYAFKQYIKDWAYKHPQPWDFFNAMNNASGEDLGWFFKAWFMENWSNDQGIKNVGYVENNPEKGALITLVNYGEMPMPVDIKVIFEDGTEHRKKLPVEIWMTGEEYVYHMENSTKKIDFVEIDPDHLVPDANLTNNSYKNLAPAPSDQSAEKVIGAYLDAIGGKDRIESIKDVYKQMSTTMQGTPLVIEKTIKNPDKLLQEIKVFGNLVQKVVVNKQEVSVYSQGQKQEITENEREQLLEMVEDNSYVELQLGKEGYTFDLQGVDNIDGRDVYVVEITSSKGSSMHYYDTENGLKVLLIDQSGNQEKYKDYQEVDGIQFPFQSEQEISGQKLNFTLDKVEVNKNISDSLFEL